MRCPGCEDRGGCELCGGNGHLNVTDCPRRVVDPELWKVMRYVRLFENGTPPIAGGALDQAVWFLDAAEYVASEEVKATRTD